MAQGTIVADQARHLRWAGGAMLAGGLVLGRLPAGAGLPCPLRSLTGIPCPLCGMQTSVKATMAGDLGAAVSANPAGVLAVAVAVVLLLTRPAAVPVPRVSFVVAALAAMWAFELARFGVLPWLA